MKRDDLINKLSDALTLEEVTLMKLLNQAIMLVDNSGFDSDKKALMEKKINYLVRETSEHTQIISKLIKQVVSSSEPTF